MSFRETIEVVYEALSEKEIERIMKYSYQDNEPPITVILTRVENVSNSISFAPGKYLKCLYKDDILELKSYIREKRINSILQ